jgi:N-acetylglucosaminyldiphosphoundecaprenol N-acetyl-beta-D-mannosaminyltransferase
LHASQIKAVSPHAPVRVVAGSFAAKHEIPLAFIGGLPIAVIDRAASARLMIDVAVGRRGSREPPPVVTSANGQVISMCARDRTLRGMFLQADLIHADGMPLVLASRLKGRVALPERVATTDLFHDVAAAAEREGVSFYLLGATPEVIGQATQKVRQQYPRLRIAGFRSGYVAPGDEASLVDEINAARPDILWIGMGVPAEQRFALRHRDRLTGVGVIKTSGGLFDFVSGKNRRAPQWMQVAGLEWLYRAGLEPRRLFYRYLTTNPHALYLLLTSPTYAVPDGREAKPP